MQTVDLQEDINVVSGCGPLKVWSVVVTILGDLLQSEEAWLSGPVLDALVGRLGINNQALRVAVHRLRRDGWIISEKRGRLSAHKLTPKGWDETEAVRAQIYGFAEATEVVWLAVGGPSLTAAEFLETLPAQAVSLSARSALVAGSVRSNEDVLLSRFAPERLPKWAVAALIPDEMSAEYNALSTAVEYVLAHTTPEGILDRAALRLVILHHWRRLRLRHGEVQDAVLPSDWSGARAQRLVMQALTRLGRPDVAELERQVGLG
ncbi:PaaX family transcriptional regulator C-terminal domain-containing protein [Shimia sagamensis]|uniref:Transcriptional regulator, PaaX family n=1 Tax=Shimia sagamensis TaxID=1566352 RepID=A0ABY1N829_9RHOB|nr:PaaX family transcriptional regulator C-terminal domain-containing protein [Shimia sagamensis]SMP02949.1 transcriptional regulator, PaaX family [Shimia sagamensis]